MVTAALSQAYFPGEYNGELCSEAVAELHQHALVPGDERPTTPTLHVVSRKVVIVSGVHHQSHPVVHPLRV